MPSRLLWEHFEFLSTPSARRATAGSEMAPTWKAVFLSTPSARRATPYFSDKFNTFFISIHALREEGDVYNREIYAQGTEFLSTPSARRATRQHRQEHQRA